MEILYKFGYHSFTINDSGDLVPRERINVDVDIGSRVESNNFFKKK